MGVCNTDNLGHLLARLYWTSSTLYYGTVHLLLLYCICMSCTIVTYNIVCVSCFNFFCVKTHFFPTTKKSLMTLTIRHYNIYSF